jgi:integrase
VRGVFEKPKGSGVWWINYQDAAGARHREKVGRESVAVEAYYQRRQEIREGKFQAPRTASHGPTFRELASSRMQHKRTRIRPKSYRADEIRLEPLLTLYGDLPAASITAVTISQMLAGLVEMGRATGTANRYRSLLSSVFAHGVEAGSIQVNPVAKVERYRESPGRIRFLTDKEEPRLRKSICKIHPTGLAEFELALNTGMRRGEQYALRWSDVDVEHQTLIVPESGKTGSRHIPLNRTALAAIARLRRQTAGAPFVCPDRGAEEQRDFRRWFEAACAEAKILDFTWHDLRHTFGSRLAMAGADVRSIQELMGHKGIQTTLRYMHLSRGHLHSAVDTLVKERPKKAGAWHLHGTRAKTRNARIVAIA